VAVFDALLDLERSIEASMKKLHGVRLGSLEATLSSAAREGNGMEGWSRVALDSVAHVAGGIALGGIGGGGGKNIPYLRVANVQDGHISTRDMKTVCVTPSDVDRFRLMSGDVLLTEGGDLDKLGRGGVWDGRIDPCLHQNHIFRVRCEESKMIPEFLHLYLSSRQGRADFMKMAKQTTNLASISSSQVKSMLVPCPSLAEQRRVVDVDERHVARIGHEKSELVKLRNLYQGIASGILLQSG
jgi:type I restriction enzyme S subunit